jgi:hypothetical protein
MINTSKVLRILSLSVAAAGLVLLSGSLSETNAQTRDPFAKPGWAQKRDGKSGGPGSAKLNGPPVNLGVPAIDQRIEFYKRLRENAAVSGRQIPKVTSVMTLDEMSVIGIFRTPRGYAAMVEATPIRLTYTIYPGEKFFDGQLVAVEENRLVFRKVTKMSNGKFVSAVENKTLRKYTDRQVVEGTVPAQPGDQMAQQQPPPPPVESTTVKTVPVSIVSPLEEMNKQVPSETEKGKKDEKKPLKVAKKK